MVVGMIIMGLIMAAEKMKLLTWLPGKLGKGSKRWLALALSALSAVGTGLLAGLGALDIVVQTIMVAFAAVGGWEFIGKAVSNGDGDAAATGGDA